ncbi:hypothetical protein CL622_02130 [archaeon]|nr:hypothetical protein [archaeon]
MYEYKCTLVRVIDGDTVDALIDLGFDTQVKKRIRLHGIDTPETRTRDKKEKKKGLAAKARLVELLEDNNNKMILKSKSLGKYGRVLGELFLDKQEDFSLSMNMIHHTSINRLLITEGHAKAYFGGKKK